MNADVYRACFLELAKEAGAGQRVLEWGARAAERAGGAVTRFGRDTAEMAVGTFRPSAWREGIHAGQQEFKKGLLNKVMIGSMVPFTAMDTVHTMRTSTDPETGRRIGLAERGMVAAGRIGSGVAGLKYMNMDQGGFLRGMGVQVGAGMATDAVTRRVGRAIDSGASAVFRHPAAAAGGAPVAAGVR